MKYRLLKPFLHYPVGHMFEENKHGNVEYEYRKRQVRINPHDLITWVKLGLLEEVKDESPQCPASLPCGCASYPELDIPHARKVDEKDDQFTESSNMVHNPKTCRCPHGCAKVSKDWPIWKTLTYRGTPDLSGIEVSDYAKDMLKQCHFETTEQTVELVLVTPKDLGFTDYPTTTELFARAKECGLDLCPPEVGPHFRAQYRDQPMGEWLYLAMKPIPVSSFYHCVFTVEHDEDGLWQINGWTGPGLRWNLDDQLVFRTS